ncbi:MAG TPA: hypothetical protein VLS90_03325, partial [Thermodesulfobacteriota bacterium]|nr:hypothetical protein [Thermodesulfobacteriota bacterium]
MKGQRRSMWFVLLAAAVILGSSGAAFGDDFCDLPGFAHLSPDFCVGLNRLVARIDTFLKNYPTILPDKSLGGDLPPFPITEPYQTIDLKGMALFIFNRGPLFTYPNGIDAAHHLEIRNGTI